MSQTWKYTVTDPAGAEHEGHVTGELPDEEAVRAHLTASQPQLTLVGAVLVSGTLPPPKPVTVTTAGAEKGGGRYRARKVDDGE